MFIMRKYFNDSSGVSQCLNFSISNQNKETCLKLKKKFSPIFEETEIMCDQTTRKNQKDMYLSRYKLDYKVPTKNSNESNDLPNTKCTCERCEEKYVHYFKPNNLTFEPNSRNLTRKDWSNTNSHNSLIDCVKNLKLTNKIGAGTRAIDTHKHVQGKSKKSKQKPTLPCKVSMHSVSTSSKRNGVVDYALKCKPRFQTGVFKPIDHSRYDNKNQPSPKAVSKKTNQVTKKIINVHSSSSILNENCQSIVSTSTMSSAHSVKDHLFDVNKFNRINHDYDIENYFCKNYKVSKDLNNNMNENEEKPKCKPSSKSHNSIQTNNKCIKKIVDNDEKNNRNIKKAYLIEDLASNTNVFNHKTRDICQNGTNVCHHISLVCGKCAENVNLKNFKLYRCDLINNVLI
jgi:hypothetical protein